MLKTTLALAAALFALPALADTHISYVDDGGQPGTQIYVKGGKVRIESGRNISIYDLATNSMTVLMPDKNKYLVFDEKTAEQMGAAQQQMQTAMNANQAQMNQAQQQLQAAMAQMTPEQRAQLQQMMGKQANPASNPMAAAAGGPQMQMQELGTTEIVAGHTCRDVQLNMNGRAVSTMCIIDDPASLGIPAADRQTLGHMRDNMQKMMTHMGPMAQGMSNVISKGFALKTTHQSMQGFNRVTVTDSFKSVSNSSLSGSLFQIPAGYAQTTMQELMQPSHP